jgi:putative ABC transport system permease protein
MATLDRKVLRDLWRLRAQVAAIALVMACGGALLIMVAGTLSALRDTRDAYYDRYRFPDLFAAAKRAPERLALQVSEIPGVLQVESRIVTEVTLAVPDLTEPASARLLSLPAAGPGALSQLALRRGRLAESGRDDEVVAGEAFADANGLKPGDRISAVINNRWRNLTIVGVALSPEFVYTIGRGALFPDDRRFGVLWMNRDALAGAMDLDGAFNDLAVRIDRGMSRQAVISGIDRLLAPYGGTGAYARPDQPSHAYLDGEFEQLRSMAWIATPIFLAVAAFLLNMVVSRLVATEREQIGVLKALGYGRADIAAHYLKLVGVIVVLGTVAGMILGHWLGGDLLETYRRFFRFPFLVRSGDAPAFAGAVLLNIAIGATATLGAVRRAAGLHPAEAMNPPAPPRYGRSLVERVGIATLGSPPTRMMVRHILRWPLRAALTAGGIAAGGAIVIGTLFSFDAIDRMIDVQMFRALRADAVLSFSETRDAAAVAGVSRMPGVLAAEAVRAVPVRLRHGHRQRRVMLSGVQPDAQLQQLIGASEAAIAVPPHGLLLSVRLADLLAVAPGQNVAMEVLEGRRAVVEVPVVALVQEYVGMGAYMDAGALARLLREDVTASGVNIRLDARQEADFFAAMRELPAVAGVTLRRTALASLRQTIAESFFALIAVYVGFAAAITFGVLFNSAHIALSERGRELATLRVLGFHRGEAAYVLFGELALLALVALPVAGLGGYGIAWLLTTGLQNDLYRVPLVVLPRTYAIAAITVLASVTLSILAVSGRVRALPMIAALKAKE